MKGWLAGAARHHLVAFSDDSGTKAVAPALGAGLGRRGRRARVQPRDACTQLPVIVLQFPVRLGQPLEPFRDAPRPNQGPGGGQQGGNGQQPEKGHQTSYLIERLATVSTA